MADVLAALMEVLGESREEAGREPKHIPYHLSTTEANRTITRWESGENRPKSNQVEEIVQAYCAETPLTEAAAWIKALIRAGLIAQPKGGGDQVAALADRLQRGELVPPAQQAGPPKT